MDEEAKNICRIGDIFTCTLCGHCCQGQTTVSLDEDDQQRMIDELGMTREEVKTGYWRVTGNTVQMKIVDGHCIFFHPRKGCTVHKGRPWRCGQWPLHPSILADHGNFTAIRESCPGLNRSLSYEDFCRILRSLLAEQGKMMF
jgi:uncharacterized protein